MRHRLTATLVGVLVAGPLLTACYGGQSPAAHTGAPVTTPAATPSSRAQQRLPGAARLRRAVLEVT